MIRSAAATLALCTFTLLAPALVDARPQTISSPSIFDNDDRMDRNNLSMVVTNHGSLAYDLITSEPGLEYPKGSGKTLVFASGLWVGAKVNGQVRVAVGEYGTEYAPGPMSGGTYVPDQVQFRNFRIEKGGAGYTEYVNEAVPQGAPLDSLGQPLLQGDALLWSVFNDAHAFLHSHHGGSTQPLGVEIQQSVFAFSRSGPLGNIVFVKWRLANKGVNQLDSAYVSFFADPDLGDYVDDLVGCDTTLSLGYAYNATNGDGVYGTAPPAVGFHVLHGVEVNGIDLGMTSFRKYINGNDPQNAQETYYYMMGRHTDGSFMYVCDDFTKPITTYEVSGLHPGDPFDCSTNWVDVAANDQRLFFSSGPFTMMPGDTQVVILAIEVGQGADRLSSIEDLRNTATVAQLLYDLSFQEPTTAVEAYVVDSRAESGANHLVWYVPRSTGTPITVERRTESSGWNAVLETTLPSGGVVRFDDTAVVPDERYGYRLAVWSGATQDYTAETWLQAAGTERAPTSLKLLPVRPNPSSTSFRIRHYVPRQGSFRLSVLDARGRMVRLLTDRELGPGWYDSSWDGRDSAGREAASGTYFLRIEGRDAAETKKLVLMR